MTAKVCDYLMETAVNVFSLAAVGFGAAAISGEASNLYVIATASAVSLLVLRIIYRCKAKVGFFQIDGVEDSFKAVSAVCFGYAVYQPENVIVGAVGVGCVVASLVVRVIGFVIQHCKSRREEVDLEQAIRLNCVSEERVTEAENKVAVAENKAAETEEAFLKKQRLCFLLQNNARCIFFQQSVCNELSNFKKMACFDDFIKVKEKAVLAVKEFLQIAKDCVDKKKLQGELDVGSLSVDDGFCCEVVKIELCIKDIREKFSSEWFLLDLIIQNIEEKNNINRLHDDVKCSFEIIKQCVIRGKKIQDQWKDSEAGIGMVEKLSDILKIVQTVKIDQNSVSALNFQKEAIKALEDLKDWYMQLMAKSTSCDVVRDLNVSLKDLCNSFKYLEIDLSVLALM